MIKIRKTLSLQIDLSRDIRLKWILLFYFIFFSLLLFFFFLIFFFHPPSIMTALADWF